MQPRAPPCPLGQGRECLQRSLFSSHLAQSCANPSGWAILWMSHSPLSCVMTQLILTPLAHAPVRTPTCPPITTPSSPSPQCVPAHRLVEQTRISSLKEVRRQHAQRLRDNKHLRYMWIPHTDDVVVVTCNEVAEVRVQQRQRP